MRAKESNEHWMIKEIRKLDGCAAVNMSEPSPGDLERVFLAYIETKEQLDVVTNNIKKLERALEKALYHINWLAVASVKYKGTDAWMSAERARKEVQYILSGETKEGV